MRGRMTAEAGRPIRQFDRFPTIPVVCRWESLVMTAFETFSQVMRRGDLVGMERPVAIVNRGTTPQSGGA